MAVETVAIVTMPSPTLTVNTGMADKRVVIMSKKALPLSSSTVSSTPCVAKKEVRSHKMSPPPPPFSSLSSSYGIPKKIEIPVRFRR